MAIQINYDCPVCGKTSNSNFCEYCGFELHILPNEISPAIMSYEQERVEKYRAMLREKEDGMKQAHELSEEIRKQQKDIESLTQQNKALQSEQSRLSETAKQAEADKPLAFLVMMQGGSVSSIFEIHEGDNSFGYAVSSDRHQQVICSTPISDHHFTIKAKSAKDAKGRVRTKYYIAPQEGNIYGAEGKANIIDHEKELEKNETIYIDNVRFTLVANKK